MELKDRLESRLTGLGSLSTQELLPVMATAGELTDFLRTRYQSTASEITAPEITTPSEDVEVAR
jgi:hypothetical protein